MTSIVILRVSLIDMRELGHNEIMTTIGTRFSRVFANAHRSRAETGNTAVQPSERCSRGEELS